MLNHDPLGSTALDWKSGCLVPLNVYDTPHVNNVYNTKSISREEEYSEGRNASEEALTTLSHANSTPRLASVTCAMAGSPRARL